jgi:Protein of unknown function, DUF481
MRRSLLLVLFLTMFATTVFGDQVTLKNGDRLSGTIVSGDGKTLQIKTDFEGDVTIQWDAVVGIESTEDLHVTLKDGKTLAGKVKTADGNFDVAGATPAATGSAPKDAIVAVRNDAEQKTYDINQEHLEHPKFTYFWSGFFDTGLALTRGNSETASYTFSGKAIRETDRDKLTVYSNYIFANDDTSTPATTTANLFEAGARGDLNVSAKTFVFAFGDFQTNQLQHLSLRQVYGGGIGYHIIKNERTLFDVFGGGDYDRDSFSAYTITNPTPPPPLVALAGYNQNSAEVIVGEEFDSHLTKRTMLNERLSFYPNLSHTGNYRIQFDTSLSTKVKAWLSWQTTFSDRYISYPPFGLKGNDLILSTGFHVAWGKPKT